MSSVTKHGKFLGEKDVGEMSEINKNIRHMICSVYISDLTKGAHKALAEKKKPLADEILDKYFKGVGNNREKGGDCHLIEVVADGKKWQYEYGTASLKDHLLRVSLNKKPVDVSENKILKVKVLKAIKEVEKIDIRMKRKRYSLERELKDVKTLNELMNNFPGAYKSFIRYLKNISPQTSTGDEQVGPRVAFDENTGKTNENQWYFGYDSGITH